jgi:hypothetical protein
MSRAKDDACAQMNRYFGLASADLVVPNQEALGLLWDFTALRQLVDTLPGNTPYVLPRFPFQSTNLTILFIDSKTKPWWYPMPS